ncbi:MAG: DUF3617 domain-containing protein [Pseudomonadota bacterium]|nr:DUF3617 domain-containing protein [Pseudomonadota bacterium]
MKRRRPLVVVAAVPSLLLFLTAADASLKSGMWEMRNTPGVATLDGRALDELPIGPIKTQTICLAAQEAANPVLLLTRDLGQDCAVASATVAGGKIRIGGTCPNQLEGPDGTFELTGKLSRDSYEVDFATSAVGDNGRMTFSGKMTGRRVGACSSGR